MLAEYLDAVFYILGKAVAILGLSILLISVIGAILILYSFKTGRFFAAQAHAHQHNPFGERNKSNFLFSPSGWFHR